MTSTQERILTERHTEYDNTNTMCRCIRLHMLSLSIGGIDHLHIHFLKNKLNEYAKRKLFVLFCLSIFVLFLMLPFSGGIVYIIILFKLSSAPITMCLAEDSRYKAIDTIQLLDWAVFYWLAGLLKLAKSPYLWCEKKKKLTSKYYWLMDVQYRIARMSTTQEYTSQPIFSGCYCLPVVHCFNASPRFDLLVGIHITQ